MSESMKVFLMKPLALKLFPLWQKRCKGRRSRRYPVNLPHIVTGIMWPFQL